MILSQVNRGRSLCAVVSFAVACAPSGTNTRATESATTATTARPAATTTVAAAQDSNITRADLARTDGSASAPVWVIIASDYQCPYCKEWHDATYPALHKEFVRTGKVRVAYVNFPLAMHAQAWPSAEAAMCAGAQGKFWEMHDAIFDNQKRWASGPSPATVFDSLARTTGVDMARWRDCIKNGVTKPLIQADHQRAQGAGVRSTPSILIGSELLAGAHPIEGIRPVLDSALARASRKE
jgi:protein-disulfide isomerase